MRCLSCGARVGESWAWCPDCGSRDLDADPPVIDLGALDERYVVEWAIAGEQREQNPGDEVLTG
jgi:hypothetical protein